MEMDHLNVTQVSMSTDSFGENAVDNRSQSRFYNRQYLPINPKFAFQKPRFPERNSYPRIPLPFDRAKLSFPNKSELCKLFQRGVCHFGARCRYAHDMSEIGKPGFKSVAEEEHLNEARQRNDVCRVRECRFSFSGLDCPYGEKCQYLHICDQNARVDLGLNRESHAINIVNGRRNRIGNDQIESNSLIACQYFRKSALYKSKLCLKYERFGSCPYGVQCTYAHGKAELKERGYYSKLEGDHAFWSMLDDVQPNNAASCQIGIETANKLRIEGKRLFMNWNIENISEIYADRVEIIH